MLLRLAATSLLITCTQAFSPAAIVWRGLPATRFAIDPTSQALKLSSPILPGSTQSNELAYFSADPDGTIRWHRADPNHKELCVEASGTPDGKVGVNICNGIPAQRWNWLPRVDGKYQIQLQGTNQCLDAANTRYGFSGALVELHECSSKATDSWSFERLIAVPGQHPSQRLEMGESNARSRAHVIFPLISLGVVGSLSLAAMLWWQKKTRTFNTVPVCQGGAFRNVDQGMMIPASMALTSIGQNPHSGKGNNSMQAFGAPARCSAVTMVDPGEIVIGWQPAAMFKIAAQLGLTTKDYADDFTGVAGSPGKIACFDGPGKPNIAWLSGLTLEDGAVERGAIAAFCGPLTDVPHLVVSCGVSNGGVDLYIDYRPREACGYDPEFATLDDYPSPKSRGAFAEAGARKDFAKAFFTADAEAAKAALLSLDGASAAPPLSKEKAATLSAGPLLVDLRLPLTEQAANAAADACTAAVDRWLGWMASAEENGRSLKAGFRQTETYQRDTKVRAQHFGFLLGKYTALFGAEDGRALAAADAGPLDEAYVGGAS